MDGHGSSDPSLLTELERLERALLDANVRSSPDALAALIDDEFLEIGRSGRSYTKHDVLNSLPEEPPRPPKAYGFALHRLAPEVALLTYTSDESGARVARRSSIWVRRPAGWRLAFHQGTAVEATASPRASLEDLVEAGLINLESLHPGGLDLTDELAALCTICAHQRILDVASGTGASAGHLARSYGAQVVGLDRSASLLDRARVKVGQPGDSVWFCRGDAHALPFADASFDAAICECTLCLLDKAAALSEMRRVVRPGGYVGMHDLAWHADAPATLRKRLITLEGEAPETEAGWRGLFAAAGLTEIRTVDRSPVKARWMRDTRRRLGLAGQLRIGRETVKRWGVRGLWDVLRAEHLFSDPRLGYAIVVGRRPH